MKLNVLILLRISAVALVLAAPSAAQSTWYVDVSATAPGNGTPASPYKSLQFALDQSTTLAGDSLLVAPGTYVENISISKNVHIQATAGPTQTRIVPKASGDAVVFAAPAGVLEGFTVCGTLSPISIGVFLFEGTLKRCVVTGMADGWAGIAIEITSGTIDQCTIIGNGLGLVGLTHFGGVVTMRNTIVWGNSQEDFAKGGLSGSVKYSAGLDSDPYWYASGIGNLPGEPGTHFFSSGSPRLVPGSPCIDAGDPASPLDPDGSRADIGAIPFDRFFVPGPVTYCTGKLNSNGCVAQIAASGQASLSSGRPFLVSASGAVPSTVGLLFYGYGPRAVPFLGGVHCVLPPTPRTAGQFSGGSAPCSGAFALDFNAYIQGGLDPLLVAGAEVFAQYWYRDPADPQGFLVGLTDAVRFLIAP